MQPIRVQRKRTKGFKLPPNTVSVARPGKWGNFLKCENEEIIYINARHRRKHFAPWAALCVGNTEKMLEIYEAVFNRDYDYLNLISRPDIASDLQFWVNKTIDLDLNELRDKNLACFCKLENKCHADVLLRLANR